MSSKLSIPKPRDAYALFPSWLMALSAVVSLVLYAAWIITKPGLDLTMTTRPLYFPEAPLWHIGLYVAAFVMMSYSMVGFFGKRADRILAAVHNGLDRLWFSLTGEKPDA